MATHSLSSELKVFQSLGFKIEGEFIDEVQCIKGIFLIPQTRQYPQYRFELLENLNPQGPLTNYLKNKTKLYHIAYKSCDIESDLSKLTNRNKGGGLMIKPITNATYFAKICFVMMPNSLLIELVETKD